MKTVKNISRDIFIACSRITSLFKQQSDNRLDCTTIKTTYILEICLCMCACDVVFTYTLEGQSGRRRRDRGSEESERAGRTSDEKVDVRTSEMICARWLMAGEEWASASLVDRFPITSLHNYYNLRPCLCVCVFCVKNVSQEKKRYINICYYRYKL